ncbi:MAG: hypothetical protein LBK99_26350, partial [Opitutaceae bacterium]|nr:hypothetical protein [Opitutaceae bacterium]
HRQAIRRPPFPPPPPPPPPPPALVPPPEGAASVTLTSAKTRWYFGEPCLIEFNLTNTGSAPFAFTDGGADGFDNRLLRFRVHATDEHGQPVPFAGVDIRGSMGETPISSNTLLPGETWSKKLRPLRYHHFDKPGRYTIRITHDLGWNGTHFEKDARTELLEKTCARLVSRHTLGKEQTPQEPVFPGDLPGWKSPVAQIEIEFVMPDELQARRIVTAAADVLEIIHSGSPYPDDLSEKISDENDFAHPVYLPILKKRAEDEFGGHTSFLTALAHIPTREAIEALIEIAGKNNGYDTVALGAARLLVLGRMPNDSLVDIPIPGWDDTLVPAVRALARDYIKSAIAPLLRRSGRTNLYARPILWGARILLRIGTPEDYPLLRDALDAAIKNPHDPRFRFPFPPFPFGTRENDPVDELASAIEALHERGLPYETEKFTWPGEALIEFRRLAKTPPLRPEWWQKRIQEWTPYMGDTLHLWEATVQSVPAPMPPECRPFLLMSLNSMGNDVLAAACRVAGDSGDKTLAPALLDVIACHPLTYSILHAAVNALEKLGVRHELAAALAECCITVETRGLPNAHSYLLDMVVDTPKDEHGIPSYNWSKHRDWERVVLRDAWRAWIAEHAADIDAGKKFKPGDNANLPAALFGRAILTLPDGTTWPVSNPPDYNSIPWERPVASPASSTH